MRLVLMTATALTLAACDRAATPAPPEGADTIETAADDLSRAGAELSNAGEQVAAEAEAAATLPDYLPMPDGGDVNMLTRTNDIVTATISVPGDPTALIGRYEQAMREAGLNPTRQDTAPGSALLFSTAKGRYIRVTVRKGPTGGALVGIVDRPAG